MNTESSTDPIGSSARPPEARLFTVVEPLEPKNWVCVPQSKALIDGQVSRQIDDVSALHALGP
jgi:hypothetical protein